MMVGGPRRAVKRLAPILDVLAPPTNEQSRAAIGPRGWLHFGPSGAGHYVKMVHNGVEYGLMQAYAEGFDVFDKCEYELDNAKIAHLWGQGSVVRSWLCELAARAFEADGNDLGSDRGLHRGLRRGALDDRGRDRPRRPHAGDHRLAVRAPALARQRRLRRPRAGGAAQPVRRPRGQERRGAEMAVAAEGQAGVEQREPADRGPGAACRSPPPRWSSSAPPATSPGANCCRRSTTSPTTGCCPSTSTWSGWLARERDDEDFAEECERGDPPLLPAPARRGRARVAARATSATCRARSTTTPSTASSSEILDGFEERGRRSRSTAPSTCRPRPSFFPVIVKRARAARSSTTTTARRCA